MSRLSAIRTAMMFVPVFALALMLFPRNPAMAQDASRAQQLRSQGLTAADRQNWQQALDLLQQAQMLAPEDPSTLYSLGVVHARAGDDVPAMFWLKAYLLAAPNAQNAVQVIQQINASEAAARAKEKQLYAAALMRNTGLAYPDDGIENVADMMAEAGHLDEALQLISSAKFAEKMTVIGDLYLSYLDFAAWTGDMNAAREALAHAREAGIATYRLSTPGSEVAPARLNMCPSVDYHTVEAIEAAMPSLAASAGPNGQPYYSADKAKEWRKSAVGMTPLQAWIACAETIANYHTDLEAKLNPEALSRASFDDPAREVNLIARYGADIGFSVARFRYLESLLVQ